MEKKLQTIQAANEGIEAITSYVEQLKSVGVKNVLADMAGYCSGALGC